MRNILLLLLMLQVSLFSQNDTACKKCHPAIYHEFYDSMHHKSSPKLDKVHQAVWDLHPLKAKDDYTCAQCHTPDTKSSDKTEGSISCTTCHTITSIKEHPVANENVYSKKPKTFFSATTGKNKEVVNFHQTNDWFGLNKTTSGSPYHTIDYTNDLFSNGKVCMGCHSHKQNSHGFELCRTPVEGTADASKNCITCHMPQVKGSATSITETPTHAYHGFAGVYTDPQLLSKHIDIKLEQTKGAFSLLITNHAPHDLMLHPLRVAELKTTLVRENRSEVLPSYSFVKLIGKEGKPTMPWQATEIVENTMIKANETRKITFDTPLLSGDRIEAKLGFYPVNPKAAQSLNLQKEEELIKFKVLKQTQFTVK